MSYTQLRERLVGDCWSCDIRRNSQEGVAFESYRTWFMIGFQVKPTWDGQSRFQGRFKETSEAVLQEAVTSPSKVSQLDREIV